MEVVSIPSRKSGGYPSSARLGGLRAAWTITLRELTDHLVSARFLTIAIFTVGLVPLTVYVGVRDYRARQAQHDRFAAEKQEIAAGPAAEEVLGFDNAFTPENELAVLRALRPPEPLSVLVRGLDASLPGYWDFGPTGTESGPPAWMPGRLADVLGTLDFEFLVRVVLGLLAILLAFDAVSGEKELGTLRAVLSQPISRPAFLMGKLAGGAITLWIPLALATLIALLTAEFLGVGLLSGDLVAKIGLIAITSAIYLLCLFALGTLVSSFTTSQKTALVTLLLVWVGIVLAVPPLATLVAQAAVPLRPRYAVETQKRAVDEDIREAAESDMGAIYREITGLPEGWANSDLYDQHKDEMDRRFVPIIVDYLNDRRRLLGEIERDAERQAARQTRIARLIMALSPAASFAQATAELAGTGDAALAAWRNATRSHQDRLNEALLEDPPVVYVRNAGALFTAEIHEPPSLAELPAFVEPRRDAGAAAGRALPALSLLLVYTALFVGGAFLVFSRYDVR